MNDEQPDSLAPMELSYFYKMEKAKHAFELWLKSEQDYATGVMLYEHYGDNAFLKSLLKRGESTTNKDSLKNGIERALSCFQAVIEPLGELPKQNTENENKVRPSEEDDAPQEIKNAVAKRRSNFGEAAELHRNLKYKQIENAEDRKLAAFRILQIFDENKPIWDYCNFYDTHKRVPEKIAPVAFEFDGMDIDDLNKIWLKNYNYIHRYKADKGKKEEYERRIIECEKIKTELNQNNAFRHTALRLPNFEENKPQGGDKTIA